MIDDYHTSIYLQLNDYNSILEQSMTLYECLRRCTGKGNESRVTCMNNMHGGFATNTMSTTWSCKAIWQLWTCHDKRNGGKLHGNISRDGYGHAIIGRYGGCFEEGKWWVIWYRQKLRGTREASNGGRVRVRIIHGLNISHKELTYLLQKSTSHQNQALCTCS